MKAMNMIIVGLAGLSLTACGREVVVVQAPAPTVAEEPTTTESNRQYDAPVTTVRSFSDAEMFVNAVKQETSLGLTLSDADILKTGTMICDYLVAGGDAQGLAQMIYDAGTQTGASEAEMMEYASLSGIAVAWLCPDQSWKM